MLQNSVPNRVNKESSGSDDESSASNTEEAADRNKLSGSAIMSKPSFSRSASNATSSVFTDRSNSRLSEFSGALPKKTVKINDIRTRKPPLIRNPSSREEVPQKTAAAPAKASRSGWELFGGSEDSDSSWF